LLTDTNGIPVGLAIEGANTPDVKMVADTLQSVPVVRPTPTEECPQHVCLDKGYDANWLRRSLRLWGFVPHIRSRGEEARHDPEKPARRWVVERTHSWINRSRRLLVRWEKKADNYLAMLHLSCALTVFRKLLLG